MPPTAWKKGLIVVAASERIDKKRSKQSREEAEEHQQRSAIVSTIPRLEKTHMQVTQGKSLHVGCWPYSEIIVSSSIQRQACPSSNQNAREHFETNSYSRTCHRRVRAPAFDSDALSCRNKTTELKDTGGSSFRVANIFEPGNATSL